MIYFLLAEDLNRVKIGYSKDQQSLKSRISNLQTSSPCKLTLLETIPGDEMREHSIHAMFPDERVSGEWFDYSDRLKHLVSILPELNDLSFLDKNKKPSGSYVVVPESHKKMFVANVDVLTNIHVSALAKAIMLYMDYLCHRSATGSASLNISDLLDIFIESTEEIKAAVGELYDNGLLGGAE